MSKYRLIKCDFRTGDSIVRALSDLGVLFDRAEDLRSNSATLKTHWGGIWEGEDQSAAIAIDKDELSKHIPGYAMDGIGFRWNGSAYDLIQDQHDSEDTRSEVFLKKLRQKYAYHESLRLSRAAGYTVRETKTENGKIQLTIRRY